MAVLPWKELGLLYSFVASGDDDELVVGDGAPREIDHDEQLNFLWRYGKKESGRNEIGAKVLHSINVAAISSHICLDIQRFGLVFRQRPGYSWQ